MELILTARSKSQETTDYLSLDKQGLKASIKIAEGNGSPKNPFEAQIKISNSNISKWCGVIHIELPFNKINPRFFLPAFMYGRNRGEAPQNVPTEFPRLRDGNPSRPSSAWWMMRSDRLSHPVALVYDSGKIFGLSASPYFTYKDGIKRQWVPENEEAFYQYGGYSCSLARGTVGYTLGYENAPLMFVTSSTVKEREPLLDNCFELESGEAIDFSMDLYQYDAKSELDINAAIQDVYYRYHQKPRKVNDVKTAVADLSKAVYQDAWLPEELSYAGQVFEDRYVEGYRYNKILSLSWTNGMSVATPMLMSALRLGDESMRQQAISCITNIIEHSLNPASGLPYDACNDGKWSINGWWFDMVPTPGHSSYICGQALFYILKAYEYEKKIKNCIHDDWLLYVSKVLEKLVASINPDGEYPYILSEKNGIGIEYDSFSGAWCMAALAYYSWLTKDRAYLDSLKKSEKHYYEEYICHMECYGAPLDTNKTVDSEGILAYIKAVRFIHAMTGGKIYLEHMKDAICYEFSFKFCYNSPVKIPPLSKLNWSSSGGSVTSVCNPHIHPMSSNIIDELLYYIENSDDAYVKDRLLDTVGWSCQTYNTFDREYDFGKKGWMSERFCYSEGLVTETYSDGSPSSTWFCLMPWAIGSILDGLAGDYWEIKE